MSCVLDASITLSFALADEFTLESEHALARISSDGALVPALWEFEVLNGLRSAEKRGRITEAGVANALHGLQRLRIETWAGSLDAPQVMALARRTELSVYDATYAWLAMERNLPLATLDAQLARAARDLGIALL